VKPRATVLAAAALFIASDASAFERQHHLGIDGGVAFISIDQKPTLSVGAGGGIHYAYGLSDAFNLLIEGAFCAVALQEDQEPLHNRPTMIENVGAGVAYTLDVTRWVPYVGLMVSGFSLHGGSVEDVRFAVGGTIAAGIDYQLTRRVALGVAVRQHFLLSDFNNYPSYTQIFLRAEYVWGF
jgi:hypothetical protein